MTVPGAGYVFALAPSDPISLGNGNAYSFSNGRWIENPTLPQAAPASSAGASQGRPGYAELNQFKEAVEGLNIPEAEKRNAREFARRLGALGVPSELRGELAQFAQNAKAPGSDPGLLFMKLYSGSQPVLTRIESAYTKQKILENTDTAKAVRNTNAVTGSWSDEEHIFENGTGVKRIEIYVPDAKNPGEKLLDRRGYVITKNGGSLQRIVWSRQLLNAALKIRRMFRDTPTVTARLADPKIGEVERTTLESMQRRMHKNYAASGIDEIIEELGGAGAERFSSGNVSVEAIEKRYADIQRWQVVLQNFQATQTLEELQKTLLGSVISLLSQTNGLQYDPLKTKGHGHDINSWEIPQLQESLEKFERGAFATGNMLTDWLVGFGARMPDHALDPWKIPEPIRRSIEMSIHYLGNAVDANNRLTEALKEGGGTFESREAILEELNGYLGQAQSSVEIMGMQTSAMGLEQLRDGTEYGLRLRERDRGMAGNLIQGVNAQYAPEFASLEKDSEDNTLRGVLAAFDGGLKKVIYGGESVEEMREAQKALLAKAVQMREMFLARRFGEFLKDEKAIAEFKRLQTSSAQDMVGQVTGGAYAYFKANLDAETAEALKKLDKLVDLLQGFRPGSGDSSRRLFDAQKAFSEIYGSLKIAFPDVKTVKKEDIEESQREAVRLQVRRSRLSAASSRFRTNLEEFQTLHQMHLSLEKSASSKDSKETRDTHWWSRFFGADWANPTLNAFGQRDLAGELSAEYVPGLLSWAGACKTSTICSPEAYKVLGGPEQKERRELILDLMREGRFEEAREELKKLDPEAARKAEELARMGENKDLENEVSNMDTLLSKSDADFGAAGAGAALQSANEKTQTYTLFFQLGAAASDFVVISILMGGIGGLVSGGVSLLAQGFKAAENLGNAMAKMAMVEKATMFQRTIGVIGRGMALVAGKMAASLSSVALNINHTLKLPDIPKGGSRFIGNTTELIGRSFKFSARSVAGMGAMGGLTGVYSHNHNEKTSPYDNSSEAALAGAIGNVAWGAKASPLFLIQFPAGVVASKGLLKIPLAVHEYWGKRGGLINMGVTDLLLRTVSVPLQYVAGWIGRTAPLSTEGILATAHQWAATLLSQSVGVTREMLENEGGVVGWANTWAATLGTSGGFMNSGLFRYGAKAAVGSFQYYDNVILTFNVFTHGFQEAAHAIFYATGVGSGSSDREGVDKEYRLSEQAQRVVDAKASAESLSNAAYLLVPGGRYSAGRTLTAEMSPGHVALADRGGKEFHEYMSRLPSNLDPMKVDGSFRQLGVFGRVKNWLFDKNKVDVHASPEGKKLAATLWLRRMMKQGKIGAGHLLAMARMPEKASGMVEGRWKTHTNHQIFWTRGELLDALAGRDVAPQDRARREAAQANGEAYRVPETDDHVFMIPEMKEAAAELLGEALASDRKFAAQVQLADNRGSLQIDGVLITDKDVITDIQERAAAAYYAPMEKKVQKAFAGELNKKKAEISQIQEEFSKHPENKDSLSRRFKEIIEKAWKRARPAAADGKLIWAMGKLEDKVKAEMALRANARFLAEKVGKLSSEKDAPARAQAVTRFLDSIDLILHWGYVKNRKGDEMKGLRPKQRTALAAWADAILAGNKGKAAKVFAFLEASGGKTLLTYVAFVPFALARGEQRGRKVWFMTSNSLLAEQYKEDWAAFSGGRQPDFKVTSMDDAKSEEISQLQNGEKSIWYGYDVIIDEADEAFRKPSNSIGQPSGELTEGNPVVQVRLDLLRYAEEFGRHPTNTGDKLRDAANAWRQAIKEAKSEKAMMARGATKEQAQKFKEEAKKLEKLIQENYGRMWAGKYYKKGINKFSDDGVETFLRDELSHHFATFALRNKSAYLKIEIEGGRVTPINFASAMPSLDTEYRATAQLMVIRLRGIVNEAREARGGGLTLEETRSFIQDPAVSSLYQQLPIETQKEFVSLLTRGSAVLWEPAEVENPLDTTRLPTEDKTSMTLKEFFQRMNEAGSDITMVSGTAGNKVQQFLAGDIGVRFTNEAGKTEMPDREIAIIDEMGKVSKSSAKSSYEVVDEAGNVLEKVVQAPYEKELSRQLRDYHVTLPDGRAHPHESKIKLMLHLAKENETRWAVKGRIKGKGKRRQEMSRKSMEGKSLTIMAPRTMDDYKGLRQALLDNGYKDEEIVAFWPDFVQQGREEYQLSQTTKENNLAAMEEGTARVVLLVPEIGGRGVDLPFKSETLNEKGYKHIIMVGENVHEVPVVEDTQAKARPGPGRIGDASIKFVDIVSEKDLVSSAQEGFAKPEEDIKSELGKVTRLVGEMVLHPGTMPGQKERIQDIADERMKLAERLVEKYEQVYPGQPKENLEGNLEDFMGRADVYREVVEGLQEVEQLKANETSGILRANGGLSNTDFYVGKAVGTAMMTGLGYAGMVLLPWTWPGYVAAGVAGVGAAGILGYSRKWGASRLPIRKPQPVRVAI